MDHPNKANKSQFSFEALRTGFIILVLVFLFLYGSLAIYLKYLAKEAVNESIAEIRAYNPNITSIQYRYLHFSPFDFLKQQLTLKDVVVHFNNPNLDIRMDSLFIAHFMGFVKDPLGQFDIRFSNVSVDQFANMYGLLATWLNNPYLYSEFGNVPNQLNLSIDGEIYYNPAENHQASVVLTFKNKDLNLFSYAASVSNLQLTSAFFNKMPVFISTLNQSVITHVHYSANINYAITLNEVASIAPGFAQYLQGLGYQSLPLSIQGDSDYDANNTQELYHFNASIENLGALNAAITYQVMNPPSLSNYVAQLLGTASNAPPLPDLIVSAMFVYQDHSLVNRIIQNLAQSTGQSTNATRTFVTTLILSLAQNLQIPQMVNIAEQINAFINNPQTLTIKLNPAQPFSMNDVANFFVAQQQRNQQIQVRLAKLPSAKRAKVYDAYLQQSLAAYSNFFNRLGLSVRAND